MTDAKDGGAGGEDFAALLAEYDSRDKAGPRGRRGPTIGELVRGRIVSIGQEQLFVDLGGKAEGMMDLVELRDDEGRLGVEVGDEIEGRVVDAGERDGSVVLRRTLGRGSEARAELEQARELAIPVEGLVTGVNKGGLEVQLAGQRAFCPLSQIDLRHVDEPASYVGQRLQFLITRYEPGPRGDLVLSRRALLEREVGERASVTRAALSVGSVVRGRVTSLKEYGAFVDLGGLEGMLHVSELGFARVAHPQELLAVGQELEVQVVRIERTDDPKRPERIALSLKSLERDPWLDVRERFPDGSRLTGRVVRVEPFGAFVEIAPGIEGLLHVSELGQGRHVAHAREVAKVGQTVAVRLLGLDLERRRLSLALAGEDDELESAPLPTAPSGGLGTLGDLLRKRDR